MLGLKQVHHIAIIAKRATRGKGIWRLMGNM